MKRRILVDLTFLFLLLAALPAVSGFALEGAWTLTNHPDLKLDPSLDIEIEFKKEIRGKKIVREMVLNACYKLSYSYELQGNDISLTYLSIVNIPRKCLDG